jgi:hypothetical protein
MKVRVYDRPTSSVRMASSRDELKVSRQIAKFGYRTTKLKTRIRGREMQKISNARRIEVSNGFMCEGSNCCLNSLTKFVSVLENYWQDNSGQVVF